MTDFVKKSREIRREALGMIYRAGSGHSGGSLSATDLLVALYYSELKIDPKNPKWEDRDRFVLSKGHAAPALYAILADLGFFPAECKQDFRQVGNILQGQPDRKKTPGVDACAGSLGQGVSVSVGMAMGAKLAGKNDMKVYALIGDGELDEGQVWEASMSAAHYKLDNLTFIIDNNGLQIDGTNDQVMSLGDLPAKFRAFGFQVIEIDGHDFEQIFAAYHAKHIPGKPKCIIAKTTKGKGVSYMENQVSFHGGGLSDDQYAQAMRELAD